jgi:Domain of Unknown Function (DUF748)
VRPGIRVAVLEGGNLDRGAIAFADRNRRRPFEGRLEPLSFALDGFTTEPQKNGAYHFEARLEPRDAARLDGDHQRHPAEELVRLDSLGLDGICWRGPGRPARSRAETIQETLIEDYGIEPDRVFVADKPSASRKSQAALQLE